ncbi:hypothetical protein [Kribbella deserti]|uniref:Uncharacterized protein n=1 Tax=Kribbella deserti TaxID=1926257 RepID=A0ABV6QQL7_9ACTN
MTMADFGQLYSVAARMLGAQGSPTWREDRWPAQRRVTFTELEAELTGAGFENSGDPARDLVTIGATFPVAAISLTEYVQADPEGVDDPLVLAGPLHTAISGALDELAARLAPGRPDVAIGSAGAEASESLQELATAIRAGLDQPPSAPRRILADSVPVSADPATHERLAAFAKTAADAVPAPDELGDDFSVRYDVAVAAADLRALVAGENVPAWRERQPGIEADRHLVTAYRWEGAEGRPVDLAEWAAELREALSAAGAPWRPTPDKPVPAESAEKAWILYPKRQALVTADLLDELAVRLAPGAKVGLIHFSSYPLQQFIAHTLRAGTTEI